MIKFEGMHSLCKSWFNKYLLDSFLSDVVLRGVILSENDKDFEGKPTEPESEEILSINISAQEIRDTVIEKPDPRSKHLLSIKVIVARLLKYLFPEMFEEMSVKKIVKTCMDSDNPDSPYLTLLSEEENCPGENKYINDLVFKITLPKTLTIGGVEFKEILVVIESQADNPSGYVLEIRALIYAAHSFLRENKFLKLATTELESGKF